MRFAFLAPALLAILLAMPTGSAGCWRTSAPIVNGCNVGGTGLGEREIISQCHYVDVEARPNANFFVYRESNGIPGLQRGDPWRDDTCGGMIPADTLII